MLPYVSNNARYTRDVRGSPSNRAYVDTLHGDYVDLHGNDEDAVTLSYPAEVLMKADHADKLWGMLKGDTYTSSLYIHNAYTYALLKMMMNLYIKKKHIKTHSNIQKTLLKYAFLI